MTLPPALGGQPLPLPPDARSDVIEDTADIWRVVITGPDGAGLDSTSVCDFYLQALPGAGFGVDLVDDRPIAVSAENAEGTSIIVVTSPDLTLITVRAGPAGDES